MILLSAIWGSSFLFIKLCIVTIPPSLLTFYRLLIATIFLCFFCKKGFIKKIYSKNKFFLFGIAIFGNVLPFNLISLSEIYVDSVVASTLIGTMPLFTLLISYSLFKNKELSILSIIGLSLGFFGMIVFITPSGFSLISISIKFSLLIVFSSFCYGLSANFVKKIQDNSPLEIATFTSFLATLFSLPVLVLNLHFSNTSISNLIRNIPFESLFFATVLGVICTGFAIVIFFNLIKIKTAVFASQSNYLIPCFGSVWGYLFLGENLSQNMFYGLIFIVVGGWLVNKSMINS